MRDLLAYPGVDLSSFIAAYPNIGTWAADVREQVEIDAGYAGYLERQTADAEGLRREEDLRLPQDLDFTAIGGLSNEAREKLSLVRPSTLGQAGRIEGITPGALTALLAHVKRNRPSAVAA
jgi:tRNA uridine 5-carboxymethylaminomethyl modification enzyme